MRVLVVGIGLLGEWLFRKAQESGHSVYGVTRGRRHRDILHNDRITRLDITDYSAVAQAFAEIRPSCVFLTAALSTIDGAEADLAEALRVNLFGGLNVLRAAGEQGCECVVLTSTDKIYQSGPAPVDENSPVRFGPGAYVLSKALLDIAARTVYGIKLPLVITRSANLVGPGDLNRTRIVPGNIERILSGDAPMVYTSGADVLRSYIHVEDAAAAMVRLAELYVAGRLMHSVFNISSGETFTAMQVVETLVDIAHDHGVETKPIEVIQRPQAIPELGDQIVLANRLRETLADSWNPRSIRSALEDAFLAEFGRFRPEGTHTLTA